MLKSLFFKHKAETDELLPPPPPFPSFELEEKPEIEESVSEDQFVPEQAEFQDEEAEEEIASAIEGVKKHDKKSFFSGLFKKKAVPEHKLIPEIEADDLDDMKKRINDTRNALMNLDLEAAKDDYIEIMRLYNKLKPEEQAKVYHEIMDLYYERKNAEELKA